MKQHSSNRGAQLVLVLVLCAVLTACMGATRLPARRHGLGGVPIQKDELELSSLESSTVRRDDVAAKLTRIDTGCNDPHLFWGRWAESKWGYWWIVAVPGGGGGDAERVWHVKNLLITFNDIGAIQSKQVIGNDHVLWQTLRADTASELAPVNFKPIVIGLPGKFRTLTLTSSGLEIVHAKKGHILIAPEKLTRFSHHGSPNKQESAPVTCHKLHFSEETAIGSSVNFCASAGEVVSVFQYLDHAAPKTMRWE